MARRAGAIGLGPAAPAVIVGALVLAVVLGPLPLLLARGEWSFSLADLSALRFTLLQASLSALLSVGLAVPVAKALHQRRYPGRALTITLMGAPFLLPVVAVALGLVTVWGGRGWLVQAGLPLPRLYGLQGVLLAHVYLNLPLAVRMILQGWQSIPAERFRLAAALDMPPAARFRHLEGPMLRQVLPGALLAVFLVCLTSFTIVLMLGGGPAATTLELAIYQAVRFDFDLARAAGLALVQFGLCALAVLLAAVFASDAGFGSGQDRPLAVPSPKGWRQAMDGLALGLALIFLALPLLAILSSGLAHLPDLPPQVWPALARSITVAVAAALLSVTMALILALRTARGHRSYEPLAMLPMAASSLVLGIGLFVVLQPLARPADLALMVTVLVNAVLAMPFAYRLLLPQARTLHTDYARLAEALHLQGLPRLRWLVLPRLRRPLGLSAGIAAALAMGDLGAIALFADENSTTLPLLVQRLAGAYRQGQAASAALVLIVASFLLFWLFDHWGRRHALDG